MAMALGATGLLLLLWVLDAVGVLNLSHPIAVCFAALLLPGVLALTISRLAAGEGSWYFLLTLAAAFLLQLYLLAKTCLRPMGMRRAQPPERAAGRLLVCGLILGVLAQGVTLALLIALITAVASHPESAMALLVFWLADHFLPPIMLAMWGIDLLLLFLGFVLGELWVAQTVFLLAGVLRAPANCGNDRALSVVLSLLPVADLVMAGRLLRRIRGAKKAVAV